MGKPGTHKRRDYFELQVGYAATAAVAKADAEAYLGRIIAEARKKMAPELQAAAEQIGTAGTKLGWRKRRL